MNKQKYKTVTHEGWMMFCPIWLDGVDCPTVWPKYKLEFLLDLATYLQMFFGMILGAFGIEPGFAMIVRELPEDKRFEMKTTYAEE